MEKNIQIFENKKIYSTLERFEKLKIQKKLGLEKRFDRDSKQINIKQNLELRINKHESSLKKDLKQESQYIEKGIL